MTNILNITFRTKYLFMFLLLSLCNLLNAQFSRVYYNDLVLHSQYDVDTFQNNYDVIDGAILIGKYGKDTALKSDITDISKLQGIAIVSGDILIQYNKRLKSLHGLDSVLRAGFNGIYIRNNDSLETLEALGKWRKKSNTDADLFIENNLLLTKLGLYNTESVDAYINNNPSLRKIEGFTKAKSMGFRINNCKIDSFIGLGVKERLVLKFNYCDIGTFRGFDNIGEFEVDINHCLLDSIVGGSNALLYHLYVDDVPNLKIIDYNGLDWDYPIYKDTLGATIDILVQNCPNLEKVLRPVTTAKRIRCGINGSNKLEILETPNAIVSKLGAGNCPNLKKINVHDADTIRIALGSGNTQIATFISNNATYFEGGTGNNLLLKEVLLPKVKHSKYIQIEEANCDLIYMPELEDVNYYNDTSNVHATGQLITKLSGTNSPPLGFNTKVYAPKLKRASPECYIRNSDIDFPSLRTINLLKLGLFDSSSHSINIDSNVVFDQTNFLIGDKVYQGTSYNKQLFLDNINTTFPNFKNLTQLSDLHLSYIYKNQANFLSEHLDSIRTSLQIRRCGYKFNDISFLNKINYVHKFLNISNNIGLNLCNSVCNPLKNKPSNFFSIDIKGNLPGCNSEAEILASCNGVSNVDPYNNNDYNNINYIHVYPNPANSGKTIFIPIAEFGNIQYDLYSITGIQVFSSNSTNYIHEITLPTLTTGMYLLKCKQGEKIYIGKLVIE